MAIVLCAVFRGHAKRRRSLFIMPPKLHPNLANRARATGGIAAMALNVIVIFVAGVGKSSCVPETLYEILKGV